MSKLPLVESCADLLRVLADETRLAVVRELMNGPKHVYEINQAIRAEQSLLSHHLKVLRESGIVEAEREGKMVLYRLSSKVEAHRSNRAIDLGCCQLTFR